MKRKNILIIGLFAISIIFQSCQPKNTYKIGYVSLQEVYTSMPIMAKADSVHQSQLLRLNNYVKSAEQSLKSLEGTTTYDSRVKAYNDTINSFKQAVEREYNDFVNVQNNRIQSAIDSVAESENYNYILSTNNSNILYAKDSTYNITIKVVKAVEE